MSHKQSCQASKERKREERSMPKHEVSWKQITDKMQLGRQIWTRNATVLMGTKPVTLKK